MSGISAGSHLRAGSAFSSTDALPEVNIPSGQHSAPGTHFRDDAGDQVANGSRVGDVLTADAARSFLDYDPFTGKLTWLPRDYAWFKTKSAAASWNSRFAGREAFAAIHKSGYRRSTFLGRTINAHQVIYAMLHDEWPEQIDHINGIRHDNRACNLRAVTKAENARNRCAARNTSGVVGVHYSSRHRKWVAYINANKRRVHLGIFAEKADAIAARERASVIHGYHPNHGRKTTPKTAFHDRGCSNEKI